MKGTITEWCIRANPFQPPEAGSWIEGYTVINGERTTISTSYIVAADPVARTITTRSGSVYALGAPSPAYVAWCKANDIHNTFPRIVKVKP